MSKHIIYQLLPRTFTNYNTSRVYNGSIEENGCGKFNLITDKALEGIRQLGATHVWYTGIIEHATQTDYSAYGISRDNPSIVKGKAGSPYAVKDYYDVDPDLAEDIPNRMQEFEALLSRTHDAGLKVIIDFVGNHVARQYHSDAKPQDVEDLGESDNTQWAFSPLNNFYYIPTQRLNRQTYTEYPAKATGNDCFTAYPSDNDWYETVKLNYGVFYQGGGEKQFDPIPKTWLQMRHILLFWAGKGIDAFRCDMAEMVPVEFWKWVIHEVRQVFPDIEFLAEVYNPKLYRAYLEAGFDFLYDKVGMYDYLRGVTSRSFSAEGISQQWQQVDDIRPHMLYFLENHDEQRIASGFFCGTGICAEPAMTVAALLGTNPVMIYAGQELGEKGMDSEGFSGIDGRTSIFDYWGVKSLQAWANNGQFDGAGLDDEQKELRDFYCRLLDIARSHPAVTEGLMYDLEYAQQERFNRREQYCFIRKAAEKTLLVAVNFADRPIDLHINIPEEARNYLSLPLTDITATDLLSGQVFQGTTQAIDIRIDAWKSMVLELTPKKLTANTAFDF